MAQVNELSATQDCRALDLPGHGASRTVLHPATLAQYTDRIAAAVDAPGVVAGHSMGAMIAPRPRSPAPASGQGSCRPERQSIAAVRRLRTQRGGAQGICLPRNGPTRKSP